MQQLSSQMMKANQVCEEAYTFLDRANVIKIKAEAEKTKGKKQTILVLWVVVVFSFIVITEIIIHSPGLLQLPKDVFWTISVLLILGIPTALAIFTYKTITKDVSLTYEKRMKEAQRNEREGETLLQENSSCLSVLPSDYWYPMATNYIYKVIEAGRACSINEALLMFDEQLHRWKMEEASSTIIAQQKEQLEVLKNIQTTSAINAAASFAQIMK